MTNNPLKKYFRQPKVYVKLPSKGIFNQPGTLNGDPDNISVYGMTGTDEILVKTPDALLNGESTTKVLESCCPTIKDAWDLCLLDLDLLLVAIRIATEGNTMSVSHTCSACKEINDYDIDLGAFVQHFGNCEYSNKVPLQDITITLHPLNYRQWTEFQTKNFQIQRRLAQTMTMTEPEQEEEQKKLLAGLFEKVTVIQNDLLMQQVESVESPDGVTNQRQFIQEWLNNCDKSVFDAIKAKVEENRKRWELPAVQVVCDSCKADNSVFVNMDQSSFFDNA